MTGLRGRSMSSILLSEFMSDDFIRTAEIISTERGFLVNLLENNKLVRTVDVTDHSESYAEDVAENWTTGIIEC